MIVEFFFGFHRASFRNLKGEIDPRGWFGHCEAWGYTDDQTWLFLDPQSAGTKIRLIHRYDDVMDQLDARFALCDSILKVPGRDPTFRIPIHGMLTCAAICGHLVGQRALSPWGLKRRLLAIGAEVIHGKIPERRPAGQGGASAGTPDDGTGAAQNG